MAPRADTTFSPNPAHFIRNLRNGSGGGAYNGARFSHAGSIGAVVHWLLSDFSLFGLPLQNWMWVFPSVLLLYAAIVIYIRSRRMDLRP